MITYSSSLITIWFLSLRKESKLEFKIAMLFFEYNFPLVEHEQTANANKTIMRYIKCYLQQGIIKLKCTDNI